MPPNSRVNPATPEQVAVPSGGIGQRLVLEQPPSTPTAVILIPFLGSTRVLPSPV
ncbi:hypothetical protein [Limnospira indica]|uniref:hypothetical protein n=1 Tax=Limnospira indica TaxID=147322 RepID=UPI00138E2F1E|nr:hypothetical protein [Limnospira indica]QNH58659.1 MAG: hypothetical protein H2674_04875 [Limnospira indica BM01]